MKTFTITEDSVVAGLPVTTEPYPHVAVGEGGRGRTLVRVPLGRRDFDPPPKRVERCEVIRTNAKGTLMLVAERGAGNRALALLRVSPGFRGGCLWALGDRRKEIALATGYNAQGLAGRMGGGEELLVVLSPGDQFSCRRTGRLYGAPSELHLLWDGSELHFGPEDEVCQVAFEDTEGDLI